MQLDPNTSRQAGPVITSPRPATAPSLLRNIILNVGGRGSLSLMALIYTPLIIHRLGTDIYGVFILASTLGGILGLLDLGITPALITSLSHAFHRHDYPRIQKIVSTAFTLYLGLGLIGSAILALLVPWMVTTLLHIPDHLTAVARFAFYISTISFAVNMWFAVFNAIPTAQERYDIVAARMVGISFISNAFTIAYLWLGGNLQGIMIISLITSLCGTFMFWIISRKLLPEIRFHPGFDKYIYLTCMVNHQPNAPISTPILPTDRRNMLMARAARASSSTESSWCAKRHQRWGQTYSLMGRSPLQRKRNERCGSKAQDQVRVSKSSRWKGKQHCC